MSNIRAPKSAVALSAALATFGSCNPRTAAYLVFRATAANLLKEFGAERASELIYDAADAVATGDDL